MIGIIIFCLCFINVKSVTVKSLNKENWNFQHREAGDSRLKYPTLVPNGIYTDFYNNGLMNQDILWNSNDHSYYMISRGDGTYYCNFTVDEKFRKARYIELVFHGIDGVALISFNGTQIGKVSNTFVRYRFDVTKLLRGNSTNILHIKFYSPIELALNLSRIMLLNYNSPRQKNPYREHNVNLLRRMQASFGAEWAPAIPSVGIWKNVELIAYEYDLYIRDILVITEEIKKYGFWMIQLKVHCDVPTEFASLTNNYIGTMRATLNIENGKVVNSITESVFVNPVTRKGNSMIINLSFSIPQATVKRWWPNNNGAQQLYPLTVIFRSNIKNNISSKTILIGFRTIKLNQENDNFYFIVNDELIFAKGASILPVSILLEKSSDEEKIDYLLRSAKEAHMNMLRVPASGIYQSDYFYQKCDEYGLLIWQDMMFDKEMYPFDDEEFLQSIKEEMTQQFTRLQYHPSVALWVANNEIQSTISSIEYGMIQIEWIKMYETFLRIFHDIVVEDKYRPFLQSTPFNNLMKSSEDFTISLDENDFQHGDTHVYSISDSWSIREHVIVPKFVSEYKSWSFPSFQSLRSQASEERDLLSVETNFMKHRQRRDTGNAYKEIVCSVYKHFGAPKEGFLDALIYASQISQAWSVKLQTERYRRRRQYVTGIGMTMGSLYWHLNDVWQMASASSIEYNGKWKMLHYYLGKAFAPVISTFEISVSGIIKIYLISDLLYDITVNLHFEIFHWSELKAVESITKELVSLRKSSSMEYKDIDVLQFLTKNCNGTNFSQKCLVKLTIWLNNENIVLNKNFILPATVSLRNLESLPNPNITTTVEDCYNKQCTIGVKTDAIALFVWLDVGNIAGFFSNNGFIMTESYKRIIFYIENEADIDNIGKSLEYKVISREYLLKNFSDLPNDIALDFDTCTQENISLYPNMEFF